MLKRTPEYSCPLVVDEVAGFSPPIHIFFGVGLSVIYVSTARARSNCLCEYHTNLFIRCICQSCLRHISPRTPTFSKGRTCGDCQGDPFFGPGCSSSDTVILFYGAYLLQSLVVRVCPVCCIVLALYFLSISLIISQLDSSNQCPLGAENDRTPIEVDDFRVIALEILLLLLP
ncbi:uncharacterized protein BJX67DRAFT_365447 [Aspergillus lucknowensis]|uniref:Uncharacterized protein n=1 Tax=Aspergillus lucknowensis TaxID=176173 RepID=A0ABR4LHG8_9EURO